MAESLPLPKQYKRLGPWSIDEDDVFSTQEALDAYLAGGSSYAGQIVALVLDGENEAQVYKVNKDKTLSSISSVEITVDANPTENSQNPVSSGGTHEALNNKVDKVAGKGLSTEDYTTEEQTKVANLPADTNTELGNKVDKVAGKGLSTEDYTTDEQTKVANLPADTNTELGNKVDKVVGKGLSTEDYTTEEQTKVANLPADTNTELGNKVDKVAGKGLSTNDYTTEEQTKVANVPADTNTELGNKVDKTTDVIEQYGAISDATKNILLDNDNWGNYDNEFIYVDQTPTELGLYPGLVIMDISGKYRYECTNNGVYRSIKAQPVSYAKINIPPSEGVGGTYEAIIPKDIEKALIVLDAVGTGQSSWDTVNVKLPEKVTLIYRNLKVIYQEKDSSVTSIVNIVDYNDNLLESSLTTGDVVDIAASEIAIKTRKWI